VSSYASPDAYDVTDYEQLAHEEEHKHLRDRQDVLYILLHQRRVRALSRLAQQEQEEKKKVMQAYSSNSADSHLQKRLAAVGRTYKKKRGQVERSITKEQEQILADLEQEHKLYHIPD
jgi:hypothetical protein